MAIWRWTGGALCAKIRKRVEEEWFMLRLTYYSLYYNSLTSWSTVIDASMEPLFWFVDHFVRYLGPAFVLLVVGLTTSVVVIFYTCLLPHKYGQSIWWTCYHMVFGHWLLCNIVFHYFKAAFTDPGHPPPEIPEVSSICKSCIAPKPPRCHHCSICNKCILRMDHHCPWMNNCVGLNNHRYFFLFCVYMWLGTIYVSISAYPLFYEHMYGTPDPEIAGILHPFYVLKKTFYDKESPTPLPTRNTRGMNLHHFVVYEFMLCSAVSLALGILVFWHGRLISLAETSIEMHINRKEASRLRRMGLVFRNAYDFGIKENWKIFLGINSKNRSFFWHVLLPSSHKTYSDGLHYHTNIEDRQRELMVI